MQVQIADIISRRHMVQPPVEKPPANLFHRPAGQPCILVHVEKGVRAEGLEQVHQGQGLAACYLAGALKDEDALGADEPVPELPAREHQALAVLGTYLVRKECKPSLYRSS